MIPGTLNCALAVLILEFSKASNTFMSLPAFANNCGYMFDSKVFANLLYSRNSLFNSASFCVSFKACTHGVDCPAKVRMCGVCASWSNKYVVILFSFVRRFTFYF